MRSSITTAALLRANILAEARAQVSERQTFDSSESFIPRESLMILSRKLERQYRSLSLSFKNGERRRVFPGENGISLTALAAFLEDEQGLRRKQQEALE